MMQRGFRGTAGGLALLGLVAALWMWPHSGVMQSRAQESPTVQVVDGGDLGPILADGAGFTLYVFDRDEPGVSNCNDRCPQTWLPLALESGNPVAPAALAGTLSLIDRADGLRQVAFNGRPLYSFSGDTAPGDMNGDGFAGVWHVARATAAASQSATATATPTPAPTPSPTPAPTPSSTPAPRPTPTPTPTPPMDGYPGYGY